MTALPRRLALAGLALLCCGAPALGQTWQEPPVLAADVAAGKLPPVAERLPAEPAIVPFDGKEQQIGNHGGELRTLIGRARDVRYLTVLGYSRLVAYDRNFDLKPDILRALDVEDGRVFTLHLRKGHKWSDGRPFTAEDFRYWWEDVANNRELTPSGPPKDLLVEGEPPRVEFLDPQTIRYSWSRPNPFFLPRLAGASPLYIYRPAHYMKQFHARYAEPAELQKKAEERNLRNWAPLHNALDNLYDNDNPDLPTLEPWVIATRPPATRFIAVRNPYYYRVDPEGRQLPYLDKISMTVAAPSLIPAKAGAGEADLQARSLSFSDFTFLRENQKRAGYRTLLWKTAKGSHFVLLPNLNAGDPVWRDLLRDVRFRRALSLAIDRSSINAALFFGLGIEGNNTALPDSPLHRSEHLSAWANFDPGQARKLLDQIGLTKRAKDGTTRLLPDGRPLEIVVETAGEDTQQSDILELIRENWRAIGIKLFTKPSQREVLRNRVYAGETIMSVWNGFETGLPTPDMSPGELAPTQQDSWQWPKWGQYYETSGQAGEKVDMPAAQELFELHRQWLRATTRPEREQIWLKMLAVHAEQQFTIGVVSGVRQPVVVTNRLHNLPKEGIWNWDPGANFGIYNPAAFWLEQKG